MKLFKGDKNVKRVVEQNRQVTRRRNAVENKQETDDRTIKGVIEKNG